MSHFIFLSNKGNYSVVYNATELQQYKMLYFYFVLVIEKNNK